VFFKTKTGLTLKNPKPNKTHHLWL